MEVMEERETRDGVAVEVNGKDDEDKLTTCRLCCHLLNEPKMLPCLHTFCLRCLEDRTTAASTTQKVMCPSCGEEFPLPVGGVGQLPVNMFVARLTERRRAKTGQVRCLLHLY